jgi:hypothetical protein
MLVVADLHADRSELTRMIQALSRPGQAFSRGGNVYTVIRRGDVLDLTDDQHEQTVSLPIAGVLAGLRAWLGAQRN